MQHRNPVTRLAAFLAVVTVAVSLTGAAAEAIERSTPGVTVIAVNPAGAGDGSFRLALTAHSERSAGGDPSCRPQDRTLRCWGSLSLRVPEAGGMLVTGFEVHRVAVGDISCGGDHGDDGCDDEHAATLAAAGVPVMAQVNGIAVLTDPGDTGLPRGSRVQVKITLTDNGEAPFSDQAELEVNEFTPGPDKPLLYETGPHTIQQVQLHVQPSRR